MMGLDKSILEPKLIAFVKAHEKDDIPKLILKGSPFKLTTIQSIAQQIKGRQIAKIKFPDLYHNDQIIYPPKLSLEQSSSQKTAEYKADFIKKNEVVIDLTGGMGIDSLAFSKITNAVYYCEISQETFSYAKHNFKAYLRQISTFQGDGIAFLKQRREKVDWIYIDPARRNQLNKKVFKFEDCKPNLLDYIDLFKAKTKKLLIKASPLIDLDYCTSVLQDVKSIHIVSLRNEVKEVLIEIHFEENNLNTKLQVVNLETAQPDFSANIDKKHLKQSFDYPLSFLYEPHAGLMKSGCFGKICKDYDLKALSANSHLFTSNTSVNFPGRKFEIQAVIPPKKTILKKYLDTNKANITCRNYPLKPNQIKKKYGIEDGGSNFVFFTKNFKNETIAIICKKIID